MRFPVVGSKFSDLRIANKLGVLVLVLCIPIAALVFVQYQSRQADISRADSETDGINYISSVVTLMSEVQNHRALMQRVLNGDGASQAALNQSATDADAALEALRKQDAGTHNSFKTAGLVASVSEQWQTLRAAPAGSDPVTNSDDHTRLIATGIVPLLQTVAVESDLYTDPNVDTRSVISALTESLPRMTEALGQARSGAITVFFKRRGLAATEAQQRFIASQLEVANVEGEAMSRSLETAMAANPQLEASLRPILQRSTAARESFASGLNDYVLGSQPIATTMDFLIGSRAADQSAALLKEARSSLQKSFQGRADNARSDLYQTQGIALVGVALALALAIVVSRSITRPIGHLAQVADRMSLGELDVNIDVDGSNEVGQLAESLRRMQTSLRSAIERLRQRRNIAA
ncbi:MAG: HAMP domain-containing protein [Anaerolineaceae bacterium]